MYVIRMKLLLINTNLIKIISVFTDMSQCGRSQEI